MGAKQLRDIARRAGRRRPAIGSGRRRGRGEERLIGAPAEPVAVRRRFLRSAGVALAIVFDHLAAYDAGAPRTGRRALLRAGSVPGAGYTAEAVEGGRRAAL